ncbi:hypothetical protein [Streptomyces sp. NPDC014623]|uniref:hypothetical protein n=1 Tax=Streptomyces sp. NPDC014623 TaxID=3364875 RepID=UPI0037011F29
MVTVSASRRRWIWAAAAASAVVLVGLVLLAIFVDLDTADRVASITGAGLGAIGLVISVFALFHVSESPVTGERGVQAGHSIGLVVTGDNNRRSGPAPQQAPHDPTLPVRDVPAAGNRGVSAGGSLGEAITGDGNQQL